MRNLKTVCKMSALKTLTNGLLKENPTFVLVLGTCPSLSVTTAAINGIGMGAATTLYCYFQIYLLHY